MVSLRFIYSVLVVSVSLFLSEKSYSAHSYNSYLIVEQLSNNEVNNYLDISDCNERVLNISDNLASGSFENNTFRIIHPSDPWTFRKLPSINNDNCGNKTLIYEITIKNPASWKQTRWRAGHTVYFDKEHLEEGPVPASIQSATRRLADHIRYTMGLRGVPGVDGRPSHTVRPVTDGFQIKTLTYHRWDGEGTWEDRAERTGINQGQGDYYVEELVATVTINVRWIENSHSRIQAGNSNQSAGNQPSDQDLNSTEREAMQQRISTLVSRAENLAARNQYDSAIENFEQAKELDPQRTTYYNRRIANLKNLKNVVDQQEEAEMIAAATEREQERIERQNEGLQDAGNTLGFAAAGLMEDGMALGVRTYFLNCPAPECSGVSWGAAFMSWGSNIDLFGISSYPIVSGAAISFAYNFEPNDFVSYSEVERQQNTRTITDKFVAEDINVPFAMIDFQLMNNSMGLNFIQPVIDIGLHFAIPYVEGEEFYDLNRSMGKPFFAYGLGAGLIVDKYLGIIVTHNMTWNVWTGTVAINLFGQ